jgi:lipopolysaccharide export system protein LptA
LTAPLLEAAEESPPVVAGGKSGLSAPAASKTVVPEKAELKPATSQADMFEVEADKVDVYKNRGEAFFQGNVKAARRDMTVQSKTLRMFYDKTTKKVVRMTAAGDVVIHWQDRVATCNQATYLINEKQMYLTGNVVMTRGEDRMVCERFYMDTVKEIQSCQGKPGKRVKVKGNIGEVSNF